jgi:hypothetical protein
MSPMNSYRYTIPAAALLILSACSPQGKEAANANYEAAKQHAKVAAENVSGVANKLANDLKENAYKTSYQVQKWAATPPAAPPVPNAVAKSYCYRSMQDVLCYRSPVPGAESRLVAYQGTDAEPPPPVITQLLPTHEFDSSQLPESRVANARPVFIGAPPEVKDEKPSLDIPIDTPPEKVPEQLPNPALVPQL